MIEYMSAWIVVLAVFVAVLAVLRWRSVRDSQRRQKAQSREAEAAVADRLRDYWR